MEKGSLHQAVLDPNPKEVLDWKVRFNICLGVANALKYLHEDSGLMIIHRNLKASNVLLDGDYNAKLTNFGWGRLYNEEDPFAIFKAGTARVYMAPEYALGQPITTKVDVYSYGVLMLEVFSGRPGVQHKPNQESAYLLHDARTAHAQRRMDKLVDPKMVNYDRLVVYNALNLAMMCINPSANLRPTMSEVVSALLQERSLEDFTIGHKKLPPGQITGITAGSVHAPISSNAFSWKMGWLGNNELQKIWVEVGQNRYTLQQIVDATRRFSPTAKIGEGRFGTVYKAEFPNDKIQLAVKRISPDLMQDTIKGELQGEIYNLKFLTHDNLITLYDGYSKKDLHLLIYEYMEKGSLHQAVLDPNPKELLDWNVRFNICLGLANALKYLHEETGLMIIHRNIKASNILLDGNYNAKLTDFGWARLYNEEDPFMTFKAGTARVYMAPEYALGQPITAKADVYSYGVVMLEVFSGRPCIQPKPNHESTYLLDDAGLARVTGTMDKLVDPKMVNYDGRVVYNALNLAMMCINPAANLRPTMSEVVSALLQERSLEDITKAHMAEAGDTSESDN